MLVNGVFLPGVLAGAIVLLALVVAARVHGGGWREALSAPSVTSGLALAAGYGLAFANILGWPPLLPVDVTQVGPWVGLLAVPLGFLGARGRALAVMALGLAVGLFLAGPSHTGAALVGHAALVALTFGVLEVGLSRVIAQTDSRAGALTVLLWVSGVAATVLFADTASLAQVLGGLAAAVGAVMVLGFVASWLAFGKGAEKRGGPADLRYATPVIAAVVATNLHAVVLYASGHYAVLAVIGLAPVMLALGLGWLGRRPGRWFALFVPAALMALPIAVAAGLAASSYFGTAASNDAAAGASDAPMGDGNGTSAAPHRESPDPDYGY